MSWNIQYVKSGSDTKVVKFARARVQQILNEGKTFELDIQDPTDKEMANLKEETEIKIDAWNTKVYGYVKLAKYSSQDKMLKLTGVGYESLLSNVHVNVLNTSQEDTSLSSGFRVIYTSKAFDVIAGDILSNTGITAGTITNYGTINIRFENLKTNDAIKKLASFAKYDWDVKSDKTIDLKARVGSATSVYQFDTAYNATAQNWEIDSASGRVYKIVVLGKGTGAGQIQGTWTHADYDNTNQAKNKTKIYQDASVSTVAEAQALAENLGSFLNNDVVSAVFTSGSLWADVQIGDAITLKDQKRGESTLRITKITRTLVGDKDELTYEAIDNDSKLRRMQFEDFLKQNKSLTEALGGASQGAIKTFEVIFEDNANSTQKARKDFKLPEEIASTADILSATLTITRNALLYDVGANTGSGTQNTSDSGHSGHGIGSYSANGGGGASAVQQLISSGFTTNVTSTYSSFQNITTITFNSTNTAGAHITASFGVAYDPSNPLGSFFARITDGTNTSVVLECPSSDTAGVVGYTPMSLSWYWPYNTASKTLTLQIARVNSRDSLSVSGRLNGTSIAVHTHPTSGSSGSGTANISNPSHTNPLSRTPQTPGSESSLTLRADLNGSNVINVSGNVGYTSPSEVDVLSQIVAGGITWQYLELYPSTSDARLGAKLTISYIAQEI